MNTYLAPANRLEGDALAADIDSAVRNPVIDGLLNTASGLLAVLNAHRQVLAINDSFAHLLGIDDTRKVLGLRPGEVVGCVYHHLGEGGCGTSAYCSTCRAAIAMTTCLEKNRPTEKTCAITARQHGQTKDLFLRVRSCPIRVDGRRMILLFLQDITREQQWESLGRVFFHDLNNIIYGLLGSTEVLRDRTTDADRALVERIHRLSLRLSREVQMQRYLNQMADADYQPVVQPLRVADIFQELRATFDGHPAAREKGLRFDETQADSAFRSDFFLVVRILTNMVVNALEATTPGRSVRVWSEPQDSALVFCTWNHQPVADTVVRRIFQRNISTKAGSGRGLGTYSMKLFGESFLGGRVDFSTSADAGTTFRLHLPRGPSGPDGPTV